MDVAIIMVAASIDSNLGMKTVFIAKYYDPFLLIERMEEELLLRGKEKCYYVIGVGSGYESYNGKLYKFNSSIEKEKFIKSQGNANN